MTNGLAVFLTTAGLLLGALPAQAGVGRDLGAWASKAARRAGVARVAVLPFSPMDGSAAAEGARAAEELATEVSRRGRVAVLERALLPSVLSEHRLGMTGLLRRQDLAAVGDFPQAQAVVVGSFVTIGNTIQVTARLVLVAPGAAVAARRAEGRRDWVSDEIIPRPAAITADQAVAEAYEYQTGRRYHPRGKTAAQEARTQLARLDNASDLRDAPADPCSGAAARANALQEDILEIKARYWAAQARKKGFSAKSLAVKPADTIPDRGLRERFLELMAECPADDAPLSLDEVRRFVSADQQSFQLLASCSPARK
ncbi:MAG: hypothetical protein HY928_12350 [Elusimicrobia bacterium]|nr:hypothetical protein [Elusimicrobiota bacterium]